MQNEEQRALNAETAAQNQALEEKAKALATARMRYKRDNKQLAAAVEDAKKRLEQHKAQANVDSQDPVARDLKNEMDRVRQLHAKLEAVRQHRLVVEEESKALFNQVVEKKADLKFKSKQKVRVDGITCTFRSHSSNAGYVHVIIVDGNGIERRGRED